MPALISVSAKFAREPAAVRPKAGARFTLDGSDELERRLASACERARAGIQEIIPARKLEAILLGGGYGRGEGGVLKTEAGDQPYNDLEFYVFISGNNWLNERRFGEALHGLARELAPEAGVEVEFKVISLAKLRHSPASMFYYDLVMGHRRLWGDEKSLAGCEHHRDARNLPLSEATRLLMNRCSGLLFAREKLGHDPFTAEDADFVGRNLAKTRLAFGDAVLAVFGQYHWSCRERHERLKRLSATPIFPEPAEVCLHHAAGMRFKLHPVRAGGTAGELQFQHDEISRLALRLWLWLENRRLDGRFHSACEYAASPADKFPGTNPWRNRLVNAKVFGPAAFFQKSGRRHPRERIVNALASLLWGASSSNSESRPGSSGELRRPADDEANALKVYQELWHQFS
jgi:hypothetical protein